MTTPTGGIERRQVAIAGHVGDLSTAEAGWSSEIGAVRATALPEEPGELQVKAVDTEGTVFETVTPIGSPPGA